jgi:DNA polymerase III delta prime subunit
VSSLYAEYFIIPRKKSSNLEVSSKMKKKRKKKEVKQVSLKTKNERLHQLTERALLLLSFKDTNTQNLRYVMNLLGIRTLEDKKRIIQEIFRLIREGIVYIPKGLPQLIERGIDNPDNIQSIDLCLLRPYDILIQEIQDEIERLRKKEEESE